MHNLGTLLQQAGLLLIHLIDTVCALNTTLVKKRVGKAKYYFTDDALRLVPSTFRFEG